ncbi:227 kDa spindle- and centromere-associated protein-like isoform X2 [Argiope bruennichi]|uniref:227 kDa spindle- and centromere-associated protein-like isoform X2 n=1 Tax=Argiope bruennichi TaxID=94029 RepID=UPI002493DDFE|nr:227 kDa spindle- and centromere-associated protein-like isoform X2 [Argiope bruennichi]
MTCEMMGQKCYVSLKMHRQLYKEHLSLQKSFCALYRHMSQENNSKNALNWIQEKNRLEATVKHFKAKALQLQRKLEDTNERCELLEFCLLELENQAKVCVREDLADKSVSTEDQDSETWERNILNNCHDCNHSSQKIMNSDVAEYYVKEALVKAEMESENYRTELQETQKKLSNLTEQLDNVLKYNCKLGVGMDYVIATVNELQSLMEWTAEKKEMKTDSNVILQKLQQLERIQKDLEKTATESELIRSRAQQERALSVSEEETTQDNEHEDIPENVETMEMCDTSVQEDQMAILDDCVKKIESLSSAKSVKLLDPKSDDAKNVLLIDLHTPEPVEVKPESTSTVEATCSKRKSTSEDSNDSLGPNISEDEGLGDESRRGDSTGPSSFIEIQDTLSEIARLSTDVPSPSSNEIIITDPEGHDKPKVWPTDLKGQTDSLDICLCAIGNLRESLRAKENELLKLSAIQNDQKQIAALQDVIINLHKESANLKSELDKTKKENSNLKEQVLELEEAENDARLQAQKLGEKLVFLQEKDTHFQAKLCETKQALEKCLQELTFKESEERELRSQLKYMEELVHKYEDQIRTMEIVELALRKKLIEEEDELQAAERSIAQCKSPTFERGTQMYDAPSINSNFHEIVRSPSKSRLHVSAENKTENEILSTHANTKKNVDICVQVPDVQKLFSDCSIQTEATIFDTLATQIVCEKTNELIEQNVKTAASPSGRSEESNQSTTMKTPTDCPIQNELLKRLHQLVEEDAHLQQQLHYVDQINLTLWKKLHNLEFHIGECKKKNMSEDGASDSCIDSECDFMSSRPVSREQMSEESTTPTKCASPCSNRGIIACLDQSEQEIKERLSKLEQINAAFEKELELREKLYTEKEKKYGEWVQTEQRFIGDLKRLSDERDSLKIQVEKLQKEKEELSARVLELQSEMDKAQERHRLETAQIKQEQQETISQLQQKVDQLLAKEKEHLKQITNLKLERSKNSDKSESDKLKSSYVELQLELSRTRDVMRKKEEEFRIRLDEARSKHCMEEARLVSELEMLRNKNSNYDEMINNFQLRQNELMDIVKQKEEALEQAREEYKKNMEITEEEHRAIEAELKSQLRQMEEETSVATRALTEERVRLEKELQENIDDLRCKEEIYKARISELENNVTHLHEELHRITGDLDSGFGSDIGNDGISNFRREKLLNQLRELRDREAELREKLDEMEQKEAAYRETLEHADRIVASVEQGYKNKIEELEISERNLKQRVGHLEEVESRLRGALHKERRSSDGRKPDDLVVELLEAEARENGLKEKVEALEQMQRNSTNKVKDLEKIREKLESELSDKEELASNLKKTQQELETARKSLTKLKKSENDLRNSLQQTENILATTESQMKNKIRTIEEEKKALEETIDELRAQVRDLKRKLEKLSYEQEEKRISATIPNQTVARTEVPTTSDADEPDYVDVDECFPEPQVVAKPCSMPGINNQNKALSMNSSNLSRAHESPKTTQIIKDNTTAQSSIPNSVDSYDSARQNLEDCMLRAMAAMKNEMEKKKLNRELNANRMKQLLSNSSDTPSVSQKVSVEQPEDDENDYDEVLPRPTNLRVVQQVGSDTLLIGWNYVNPSLLEGFEVYVDGTLHETVYTPDRTKALISGLNLKRPLRLSISALSKYGQMSEPTVLDLPPQNGNNGFYLHVRIFSSLLVFLRLLLKLECI